MGLYHLESHHRRVGDVDGPVHIGPVRLLAEQDLEFGDVKSFQGVQPYSIHPSSVDILKQESRRVSLTLTLHGNSLVISHRDLRQFPFPHLRPSVDVQVDFLVQHDSLRVLSKRRYIVQLQSLVDPDHGAILGLHPWDLQDRKGRGTAEQSDVRVELIEPRVVMTMRADDLGQVEMEGIRGRVGDGHLRDGQGRVVHVPLSDFRVSDVDSGEGCVSLSTDRFKQDIFKGETYTGRTTTRTTIIKAITCTHHHLL